MDDKEFGAISEIKNYQDLEMHRMRLKIENDFLEEKISDNYELAKYELHPAQLLDTYISRNFHFNPGEEGDGNIWQMILRVFRIVLKSVSK